MQLPQIQKRSKIQFPGQKKLLGTPLSAGPHHHPAPHARCWLWSPAAASPAHLGWSCCGSHRDREGAPTATGMAHGTPGHAASTGAQLALRGRGCWMLERSSGVSRPSQEELPPVPAPTAVVYPLGCRSRTEPWKPENRRAQPQKLTSASSQTSPASPHPRVPHQRAGS